MLAKILLVLLTLVFSLPAQMQAAEEFEYGPRPPLSVFDPNGLLRPEMVKEISDPLAAIYKNEGVDVVVVVLTDLGQAPPEHVAGRFAEAWCKSPIHCVVLHVPGREDSPWILPSGKLVDHLKPEQVQQAVTNAQRRAASEPTELGKVKAASTEAADMLRYWMANAINHSAMIQTESHKMRSELEAKSRRWKTGLMVFIVSLVPFIAGISMLLYYLRKRGPGYFPNPSWQPRLGAPHAGGNHATADLGSPLP